VLYLRFYSVWRHSFFFCIFVLVIELYLQQFCTVHLVPSSTHWFPICVFASIWQKRCFGDRQVVFSLSLGLTRVINPVIHHSTQSPFFFLVLRIRTFQNKWRVFYIILRKYKSGKVCSSARTTPMTPCSTKLTGPIFIIHTDAKLYSHAVNVLCWDC
jgi:hypothetical protein